MLLAARLSSQRVNFDTLAGHMWLLECVEKNNNESKNAGMG